MANATSYELSRAWFDWCFENPDLVTPNHTALFFFAVEHCNRLGWKTKFGFPMEMAKNAIGIKNYRTYSKTFEDLVAWGFFEVHQRSKNQWSANVIAIVKNTKANTKAFDKAIQKHSQKQSNSSYNGSVGIDKQIQTNTEPITINNKQYSDLIFPFNSESFKNTWEILRGQPKWKNKTFEALQASLKKMSKHSENEAIQMMEDAISGNYQGIFSPKNSSNGNKVRKGQPDTAEAMAWADRVLSGEDVGGSHPI